MKILSLFKNYQYYELMSLPEMDNFEKIIMKFKNNLRTINNILYSYGNEYDIKHTIISLFILLTIIRPFFEI